jgi:hypothetical protein
MVRNGQIAAGLSQAKWCEFDTWLNARQAPEEKSTNQKEASIIYWRQATYCVNPLAFCFYWGNFFFSQKSNVLKIQVLKP